jgi:hypothetical protein
MATVQTRGKSFTLPTSGTVYDISTQVPLLFTDYDPTILNSKKAIVNIAIKSLADFAVQIKDYTSGIWTDIDSVPVIGTYAVFNISNVSIIDFRIRPSVNTQSFYVYLSGEIS